VTSPNPALVSQQAVQRLPRVPLLLLCAAYVLPGLFGRDPWKNADITAFGYMVAMAQGRTPWWHPLVAGLPVDTALLPHWLGAAFIALLQPWVDPALAARLPFAGLLAATLWLTWYACFHFARTDAAQPLPFAFGGEAKAVDYARAIADGALLALVATLGLLQLGHETTPELAQLFSAALFLWGAAIAPYKRRKGRIGVLVSLPLLAASGAPAMALAVGAIATAVDLHWPAGSETPRHFWRWTCAATVLSAASAVVFRTWGLRWHFEPEFDSIKQILRLLLWFLWPSWVLGLWTVWRWRRQLAQRHLALPLAMVLVAVMTCVAMGGSDRALLLALPALAVLAAFALPTLKRSTTAAIDWFSVCLFTGCAIFGWVMYLGMQVGLPRWAAATIARLAPGFHPAFSLARCLFALLGTLAWLWLVRWRSGRHRQALWKSLVLPASGVALCWLLVMTLWLPAIDYDRSYRPWVARFATQLEPGDCISAPGLPRAPLAALEYFGHYRIDGRIEQPLDDCPALLLPGTPPAPPGWALVAVEVRPAERVETTTLFRRAPSGR
jgi:hypothetical protein